MKFSFSKATFSLLTVETLAVFSTTVKAQSVGDALVFPSELESENGLLDITLTLEYADHDSAAHSFHDARLFGGTLPGPTLKVNAGDTMRILFQNKLQEQVGQNENENEFSIPDTSNLHFHGAHVSGELPSDDVTLKVEPGSEYQYETHFPTNHMPGTHWVHPHVHGSGSIQVSSLQTYYHRLHILLHYHTLFYYFLLI